MAEIDERIDRLRGNALSMLADKRLGLPLSRSEADSLTSCNSILDAFILLERRMEKRRHLSWGNAILTEAGGTYPKKRFPADTDDLSLVDARDVPIRDGKVQTKSTILSRILRWINRLFAK
jgi:hypothetical protein